MANGASNGKLVTSELEAAIQSEVEKTIQQLQTLFSVRTVIISVEPLKMRLICA